MSSLKPLLAVTVPIVLAAGLIIIAQHYGRAPLATIGQPLKSLADTLAPTSNSSSDADPQQQRTVSVISSTPRSTLVGRFLEEEDGSYLFEWPLSTIRARLQGSELKIKLEDASDLGKSMFQVLIGGKDVGLLRLKPGNKIITAVTGQPFTTHDVEIIKRTEAHVGTARFSGFVVEGQNRLLEPPEPRQRRLLFIGDSITAGYGVLCNDSDAPFAPETQSALHAYAAVAARALEADAHVIAYSGKGVYRNNPHAIEEPPMTAAYHTVLPQSSSQLRFELGSWRPHAVVINLATNDYSDGHKTPVDETAFVAAYKGMLKELRLAFGRGVKIMLCLGSMLNDTWPTEETKSLSRARRAIHAVIDSMRGDQNLVFLEFPNQDTYNKGRGCSGHPNEAVHREMAAILEASLNKELAWA